MFLEFVLAATLSEYLQAQWAARARHAVAVVEAQLQGRAYLELPEKRKLVWEPGPGGPRGCCELLEFRVDRMLKIVARRQLTGVLREATLVMPSSPMSTSRAVLGWSPGQGGLFVRLWTRFASPVGWVHRDAEDRDRLHGSPRGGGVGPADVDDDRPSHTGGSQPLARSGGGA